MKKVEAIKKDKEGNITEINLSADYANDNWLYALRLLKAGKKKELRKMENTPMYYLDIEK